MPRSLMNTVRSYWSDRRNEDDDDHHAMFTRSGLSIRRTSVGTKPGTSGQTTTGRQYTSKEEKPPAPPRKRHSIVKYKSLSYMSFVTRFYLCLRTPNLDMAGVNPRETLQVSELCPFSCDDEDDSDSDDDDCDDSGDDIEGVIDDEWGLLAEGETSEGNTNGNASRMSDDESSDLDAFILTVAENLNNSALSTFDQISEDINKPEFTATPVTCYETNAPTQLSWSLNDVKHSMSEEFGMFPFSADTHFDNVQLHSDVSSTPDSLLKTDEIKSEVDIGSESSSATSETESCSILPPSCLAIPTDTVDSYAETTQLDDLDLKMKISDATYGRTLVKCPECDRLFSMISAYTMHLKTHLTTKNTCFVCGKMFTRSWLLKGHMRTHTGEKPYPCPERGCDKWFADKSNLRSHMLTHTATKKKYNCERCGRSFAQKRYLHKHILEVCRMEQNTSPMLSGTLS